MVQDGVTTSYTYDALGQLIRVVDGQEGATWEYSYDQGGNILSKKKFVDGVETESTDFEYTNTNWRDQLTAVNGVGITYDDIGNPLNDGEWTYTWQNGRQLASMTNGETTASFVYNENGLRVQKTVDGIVTNYTLHGKNVVHLTCGNDELHFFYDASNKPAVVVYNGVPYSYVKNLQGDIVAILDTAGNVVVSYVYDAWGRPISKTGSMAATLGTVQPFRYRGYVYDEGTGLYYLRSRYYNAQILRFLNSDQLVKENVFSYAFNKPVMQVDFEGTESTLARMEDFANYARFVCEYYALTGVVIQIKLSDFPYQVSDVRYSESYETIKSPYLVGKELFDDISNYSYEASIGPAGPTIAYFQCCMGITITEAMAMDMIDTVFQYTSLITSGFDSLIVENFWPELNDTHIHYWHHLEIDWAAGHKFQTFIELEVCSTGECGFDYELHNDTFRRIF